MDSNIIKTKANILLVKTWLMCVIILTIMIAGCSSNPLHEAVKSKDVNRVKQMLDRGIDVNEMGNRGITAMHIAAEFGTFEIVKLLIEYGANVNAKTMYGVTPLHFAAQGGDIAIANLLISRGAIVNAQDDEGRTPLLWIVGREYASRDMIDLLELHDDANEIWQRVKSKEDYKRVVLFMKTIDTDEFNNTHMIKRTPQEIQEYLDKLIDLR